MPFRFDDFFSFKVQLIDLFSICRTGNGYTQFELLKSLDDFFRETDMSHFLSSWDFFSATTF